MTEELKPKKLPSAICMCCGKGIVKFMAAEPTICMTCRQYNLPCIICGYEDCVSMEKDVPCPYKVKWEKKRSR